MSTRRFIWLFYTICLGIIANEVWEISMGASAWSLDAIIEGRR